MNKAHKIPGNCNDQNDFSDWIRGRFFEMIVILNE